MIKIPIHNFQITNKLQIPKIQITNQPIESDGLVIEVFEIGICL